MIDAGIDTRVISLLIVLAWLISCIIGIAVSTGARSTHD